MPLWFTARVSHFIVKEKGYALRQDPSALVDAAPVSALGFARPGMHFNGGTACAAATTFRPTELLPS